MDQQPDDDHYIANRHNAHIDTSAFEEQLLKRGRQMLSSGSGENKIIEDFYIHAFRKVAEKPASPKCGDDQLICRYLSPEKFLWFAAHKTLFFPIASQFDDPNECSVPDDYDVAVLKVLSKLELDTNQWKHHVRAKAGEWNVSCWTELTDYYDDHLLWDKYCGGPQGVGITIWYGELRNFLAERVKDIDVDGSLQSGVISYGSPLCLLPFNKHRSFRNEREVRFAFRHFQGTADSVDARDIFHRFGIRLSPAAQRLHVEAAREIWQKCGGVDRYQWPRN